jgi:FKBP-type peptidyl-prolyl cis-trans isomerase
VGTDKRERQKAGRQARIEQEMAAAKRQRGFRTFRNLAIIAVVVLGGAFAYSALKGGGDSGADEKKKDDKYAAYSDPATAKKVLTRGEAKTINPAPAKTAADALEKTTLIPGKGKAGTADNGYVVEYVGVTPDGKVFDKSWGKGPPNEPFSIDAPLGQAQLIQGWKEGLVGAKIGERRHLVIGSNKAYGAQGNGPIKPNTPLAFDIDIVDITSGTSGQ